MFSHQEGGHFSTDFHMLDFDGFEGLNDTEQGFELHDIKSGMTGSSSSVGFDGIRSIDPSLMATLVDQTTTCNNNDHNVVIHGGHSDNSGSEIIQQERNNNVQLKKKKDEEEHNQATSKKIRWSGPLHTRFLKAASIIGLQKLTPKKVLKLMNVPGLTRRNVASHLQKYRLFLKRFADKNYPEMKDRERALDVAFSKTMPNLNTKQRSADISIPCSLSFFRTILEWKRASFSDYIDDISAPVYVHPSVPSGASNRGSTKKSATNKSNLGTHSNGAALPPTRFMQNHHQNASCGPRNHATPFNPNRNNNGDTSVPSAASNHGSTSKLALGTHLNGAAFPPTRFMQNRHQNVYCGPRNHATTFSLNPNNNGGTKSEPVYVHQSVPSATSNRGSTNKLAPSTHSNGAALPPTRFMQNHHQNVSCGPRNHATTFSLNPNNNGGTKSEPVYVHPSVPSAASNRGSTNKLAPSTHSNGAALPPTRFMQNHHQNVSCGPSNHATLFNLNPNNNGNTKSEPVYVHPLVPSAASNHGSANKLAPNIHFNGAALPPARFMHNHHENVSCGPRNHATPFNSNPSNNGMINFHKQSQVNGNATIFGSDQGKLGGQGIYQLNDFEISCFDMASGATVVSDHIVIPSTELGQENFSSYVTQEEQPFASFSAMNDPPAACGKFGPNNPSCQQVNNEMSMIPQQGWGDASVLGAGPAQIQHSNDLFDLDDDKMWTDEFVAALLEDIRPLLED